MSDRAEKAIEDIALSHESLRAERDALRAKLYEVSQDCIRLQQEVNCLRMEPCQLPACEALRARAKRMEKALRDIKKHCEMLMTDYRTYVIAKEALRDGEVKVYLARNGPDTTNEGIGVPPKKWEKKAK